MEDIDERICVSVINHCSLTSLLRITLNALSDGDFIIVVSCDPVGMNFFNINP